MSDKSFVSVSPALSRIPGLATLLEAPVVHRYWWGVWRLPASVSAVLAWGRKPSSVKAGKVAARLGLPVLRLEDGFLRSVAPGAH